MVTGDKFDYGALGKSLPKPAPPSTTRLREAPTPKGVGEPVDLPDTDLFRRAVVLASRNRQISAFRLKQALNISLDEVEQLMNQLVKAGIIERPTPSDAREIQSETDRTRSFFVKDDIYNFRTNEENIDNAKLQKSLNNDNLSHDGLTTYSKITDIENIDSSYSDIEIENLINEALSPLLARTELSVAQKIEIVRASSTSLKSCLDDNHGLVSSEHKPTSWVDSVGGRHKTANADALALADKAPAIWRDDKLTSDTPPDFIKRHYGPWLNVDATGLTRPDIKRLDPSLYTALANWLRKNELPDDCPVPIKSESVNADIRRFLEGGIGAIVTGPSDPEHVLREARRIASASQRRR